MIARSVTFPNVLNLGQAIIDIRYPNASILCLEVAHYSGLAIGLIWSMDRELVEEYDLHDLIDLAGGAVITCELMFMPHELLEKKVERQLGRGLPEEHATTQDNVEIQVVNLGAAHAALPAIEEKTPAVSMEDAIEAVVGQIEEMQAIIRFAQTVKSMRSE